MAVTEGRTWLVDVSGAEPSITLEVNPDGDITIELEGKRSMLTYSELGDLAEAAQRAMEFASSAP